MHTITAEDEWLRDAYHPYGMRIKISNDRVVEIEYGGDDVIDLKRGMEPLPFEILMLYRLCCVFPRVIITPIMDVGKLSRMLHEIRFRWNVYRAFVLDVHADAISRFERVGPYKTLGEMFRTFGYMRTEANLVTFTIRIQTMYV